MSFDRNELEQEALKFISRDQLDRAIECYAAILRRDTRDVRARQKIAELYLKSGKRAEAFRQFKEVARLHTAGGNHRAALALYKQLIKMKPDDAELETALADSYFLSGFRTESTPHYESAFAAFLDSDPGRAVEVGRQLLKLRPDDVALRLRLAELVRASKPDQAYGFYREAIDEYRRRGQMAEVARVAKLALAVRPGEPELLVDAAEACLAAEERDQALEHLRAAVEADPQNERVLDLLARTLEGAGQGARAAVVWRQLAQLQRQRGDLRAQLASLEHALATGASDPDLVIAAREAREAVERTELRLTQLTSAEPATQEELRLCTRAEVFARYGLYPRALDELRRALVAAPSSAALLAWSAEVASMAGDTAAALAQAGALLGLVGGAERAQVETRMAVLRGESPPASPARGAMAEEELVDDEDAPPPAPPPDLEDEELVDDEPTAPPPARPAPPPARPAPPPAPAAFASAFEDEGGGDDLFADVFRGPAAAPPSPPPRPAPAPSPAPAAVAPPPAPRPAATAAGLEEARGLVGLGMHQEALDALAGAEGLEAAALRARCQRELGDLTGAERTLRAALLDAADEDPGLGPVLFELADLSARAGRRRVALRCLTELEEFHPEHRAAEVSARVKALRRVLGR